MIRYPVSLSNSVFSNVTFVLHTSCAGSTCTREISQQHTSGFLVFFLLFFGELVVSLLPAHLNCI